MIEGRGQAARKRKAGAMIARASLLVLVALAAIALAGVAQGKPPERTDMDRAEAAGWRCDPKEVIGGYFHCAPPGKPSLQDLISGKASPSSLQLRAFSPDGSFAGTETLLRADRYGGQPCPQDDLEEWELLDLPVDYRACHNFDA